VADITDRDGKEKRLAKALMRVFSKYKNMFLTEIAGKKRRDLPPGYWVGLSDEEKSVIGPFVGDIFREQASSLAESIAIGFDWSIVNEQASSWARQHTFDLVKGIDNTTRKDLQSAISQFFEQQMTRKDLEKLVASGRGAFSPVRSSLISVTETTRAASEGEQRMVRELREKYGIEMDAIWQTRNDELVCPICGPRHGKKRGDGWTEPPPAHPNCLPGDALVTPVGGVSSASKRFFKGDIVTIGTAKNNLSVTPNHPILTDRGWVAACNIVKGDKIGQTGFGKRESSLVEVNNEHRVSRIKDIFGSLNFPVFRMPTSAPDFHGDGAGSNVAIIRANSEIVGNIESVIPEPLSKKNFIIGNIVGKTPLVRLGAPAKLIKSDLSSTHSIMSRSDLGFAFRCGHTVPLGFFGSRLTPWFDSILQQTPSEGSPADPDLLREAVFRLPFNVSFQEVVKVGNANFSGHVYNLQTDSGVYVANNIITHNCRCFLSHELKDGN